MKKYLATLSLILCTNCFADNPVEGLSGDHMISHIIGEVPQQTYHITSVPAKGEYAYGNNIRFDPVNLSFASYYTAPCGNDCFPSSRGTYTMEGEQHIRLYLTNVSQDGDCESYNRAVQKDLGVFLVEKNETADVITLTFAGP